MTSTNNKINYLFGVDYNSEVAGTALIPSNTGRVSGGMEISKDNIIQMLKRPNLFEIYSWTAGSVGVNIAFPGQLFEGLLVGGDGPEAFFGQFFSMFAYVKFGMRFRIKVNGSPFHKGLLGVYYIPGDNQEWPGTSFVEGNAMVYPSVRVSAAGTSEYTLDIPPLMPWEYMYMENLFFPRVDGTDQHGLLSITPWTALESVTGAPSTVTVSVWFEFTDLQIAGPTLIFEPTTSLDSFQRRRKSRRINRQEDEEVEHQGIMDAVIDPLSGAAKSAVSGVIDGVGSGVKKTAKSIVASIPLVGSFLSGFMDKPPLKTEPLKICRTSATSWTHGVGNSAVSTLTVVPGLLRPPKSEEVGEIGDVKSYLKIPAVVRIADLTTSSNANAIVFACPVSPSLPFQSTPNIAINWTSSQSTPSVYSYHTPMSYMALMYSRWRGTINYTLEVVMPATTTCTLGIAWLPDHNLRSNTYDQIASQCATWLIDCNGPTTSHFGVNYMGAQHYKYTYPVEADITHYGAVSFTDIDMYNGFIGVFLVNTVMSNVAAPTTVTVRMYQAAGDDFELCMPSDTLMHMYCYGQQDLGPYAPPPLEHQGLTDDVPVSSQQLVTSDEVTEVPKSIMDQPTIMEPYLGESHMEASYFKRYQLLYREYATINSLNEYVLKIPVCPTIMSYLNDDGLIPAATKGYPGRFSTPLNHFGMAFRYWRGSMNYRLNVGNAMGRCTIKAYFCPNKWIIRNGARISNLPGCSPFITSSTRSTYGSIYQQVYPDRYYALEAACASNWGLELVTNVDAGIVDVNVPFYSEQPVKSCVLGSPKLGDVIGNTGISLIGSVGSPFSSKPQSSLYNHMTGNVVFVISGFTQRFSGSGAEQMAVEVYYAAGDDLVFTYPVVPPSTQIMGMGTVGSSNYAFPPTSA
jgi:hypothetical protein